MLYDEEAENWVCEESISRLDILSDYIQTFKLSMTFETFKDIMDSCQDLCDDFQVQVSDLLSMLSGEVIGESCVELAESIIEMQYHDEIYKCRKQTYQFVNMMQVIKQNYKSCEFQEPLSAKVLE